MGYVQQLVEPELDEETVSNLPVVKSACLKFLVYFRAQIPPEAVVNLLPKIANQLTSDA